MSACSFVAEVLLQVEHGQIENKLNLVGEGFFFFYMNMFTSSDFLSAVLFLSVVSLFLLCISVGLASSSICR